ncbi:carbohydrate ABC transporter permease [Petrotoga sp. 9PWA.NaAc.5.4]|uniref:carbohydrate ABC transporter permease n=1 Tax=Petrotoga sp. 9PWA.NaAc.5.4 TaxID=1434328 RepID=UPI000CB8F438|nr:sugar ABC transporter permease [Petrotoga sp. 9PWA.NaAc.5.4]PNR95782.1 sugar ABC transporter permease [Petrotoga sp. 9PWA.NaAc.5.4]
MKKALRDQWSGIFFALPFMIIWGVFTLWPVISGFIISLHNWDPLRGSEFIGFKNYTYLFTSERFWNAFLNTFEFAIIMIPLTLVFGLLFAFYLYFSKSKTKAFVESALFFPYLLNVSIISLIWKWLFDPDFGLIIEFLKMIGISNPPQFLNHPLWVIPAIAFASSWWLMGYRMTIFRAALESQPFEIVEAALIDGANKWQIMLRILFPLIRPQFLFATVLTVISGFDVLGQVMIMTDGGPGRSSEVLALLLYREAFSYFRMGRAAAIGFILFVVIFIFTLIALRYLGKDVSK